MSELERLGFDAFFADQVTPEERGSLRVGRAVEDRGPRLLVRFEDGARLVTIPGRLRAAGEVPVVGDFVLAPPGDAPPVARVLARRSRLSRGVAGRTTAEQVLVANVDRVFLVHGLDAGVKARRIERTVVAVYAGGAEPVVVLTKVDLDPDPAASLAEAAEAAPAVPVVGVSTRTGEGVEAVRALLPPGRTGVFVGPSGAGKSTLVNALLGADVQPTGAVREADRRGRHTTTTRRLFEIPGAGLVVDGPGIRELKLWQDEGLGAAFEDVAALAERCRFRDCRHEAEPGCEVRAAVEDGRLDPARLASLHKLAAEARSLDARRAGAAQAERGRWKAVSKAARQLFKDRGRE